MEENKDAQNASQDVLDDGNASPSTSQDHVVGDDETAQSTDSGAITNNSTQNHMKQDSVDSYNTIVSSSSSSSSSVEFKEANSGGETAAQEGGEMTRNNNEEEEEEEGGGLSHKIEQKQSHEHNTTSIEKRLSNVSLTSETTPSDGGNASVLRDEEASSLDRTGDRASTAFSSSSSSRRISLQPQDSATSSVVQANGDSNNDAGVSLPGERLSRQSAQPDNTDDESKRSSRINDLETSTMQSVVLSDLTRPTSEALTPSAPTASTSTSTSTDTDNNNKHLSANDAISSTEMKISQTRQSTASSTHNYDLIQQRAEHHHQDLEEHPKRHKRTQRGSEDLRANFDKLREELQGGAGTAGGSSNSPTSSTAVNPIRDSPTHDGLSAGKEDSDGTPPSRAVDANGIDWDFWGEVMNDYEGIAKTRRECQSYFHDL